MITPKYNVGDVLKPVLDDTGLTQFHVIEVLTQTCPANIAQIKYLCRVHTKRWAKEPAALSRVLFDFNEIEIEMWTKQEDKKGEENE